MKSFTHLFKLIPDNIRVQLAGTAAFLLALNLEA